MKITQRVYLVPVASLSTHQERVGSSPWTGHDVD